MRGDTDRCRHAGNAQERDIQLQSGLFESADSSDQTENAVVRRWQLQGEQVVLSLDESNEIWRHRSTEPRNPAFVNSFSFLCTN